MGDAGPQQIGHYTIIRLLSESSRGHTYLGKDERRRKKYAVLKIFNIPLATRENKEAFLSHAKQLKKFKRSNITEVLDFGIFADSGGQQDHGYLVIEYVEGETILKQFGAGKRHTPNEIKPFLFPIAEILQYAHASHIVHGNLHPGNILLGEHIRLTDFSPMPQELLQSFDQMGTHALPYKAPEHLRGTLIAASDQYSLAVMVYEWLCGRRPYTATEREPLLYQQEHEPLPLPRCLNSKISPPVEAVLLKALSLNPEDRFEHMLKFSDAYLRALMGFPMTENKSKIAVESQPSQPEPVTDPHGKEEESTRGDVMDTGAMDYAPTERDDEKGVEAVKMNIAGIPPEVKDALEGEEENTPEERSHRPLPSNQLREKFSQLSQIVTTDLGHGGILSERLEGYEERQAQIEMATLVARSLTEERPVIIEAATGTGKTLSYLLPIVRSGKVAIISTANKALQEQLFFKDIPFVKKNVQDFEAALVKGIGNYVCLDRMDTEHKQGQALTKNPDFTHLLNIVKEFELTISGDFETLGFSVPGDLRSMVNADRDLCTWAECDFFSRCYVREMKERAEKAQIIVVNHTLLLLDAATYGHVLPQRDLIVLDEAHHLEEEATRAFTISVSQSRVNSLLSLRRLQEHSSVSLQEEAKQTLALTWGRLDQVAGLENKGRANLHEPLEEGLRLATIINQLATSLEMQRPLYMPDKESTLYDKLVNRTKNLAEDLRKVFSVNQMDSFVYYVERVYVPARRTSHLEVSAAPLDVTAWLKEHLFSKSNVICTSATLATVSPNPNDPEDRGPNFAYYRRRVGLDYTEYPHVLESILPLTFDYEKNALLYLPRHLPEPVYGPESNGYTKAIAEEMMRLVEASRGRAFLLFSSKRMLNAVYNIFLDNLPQHLDFDLLRQGDYNRIELVRRFRESEGAVLFGLKSFWEGVDIQGESLSLVVIDKMPFDPPDDPVHEARVAQMKASGENWFGTYVLPQAVLRLKQGLGRLLRTHEDRGVMAILDTRLYTKSYGKLVINALPPARRTVSLRDVERFFAAEDTPF